MFRAFQAVFWSFFGVRKGVDHDHDAVTLTPAQVIFAAVVSALVFIFSIALLVYFVTR
jgi:ABC-type Na+ efflux pump permease subunit